MLPVKRPYLGELETAVMEHLWHCDSDDAKSVHQKVGTKREISLNTIQSTLERLFRKKLLNREKVAYAYVYSAAIERGELMSRLINDVVNTLSDGKSDYMLSAFVDFAARSDESSLDKLERLIALRRAENSTDKQK